MRVPVGPSPGRSSAALSARFDRIVVRIALNAGGGRRIIGLFACRCAGEDQDRPTDGETRDSMKVKTRHRKSYKWKKKADSSPVAKGRRAKIHGVRNPRKAKRAGGRGL
jgi:hypothetical protein